MPEPTSTAVATVVAASAAVPPLTAFGVSIGLRPDILIAGFSGGLVAIALLNTVPGDGDTWKRLVQTSVRRMGVTCASSLTAGYLTPMALLAANVPDSMLLGMAFMLGVGAQKALVNVLAKYWPQDPTGGAS